MISNTAIFALFKKEASFLRGVDKPGNLPKMMLPEVAFIGKSNVGKSSLINAVCNNKSLAKTSNTPGRTQQINFFQVGTTFTLVDLPGYGFAKVPDDIHKNWERLIVEYLSQRENLVLVNVLVDGRHGIKDNDIAVINLLEQFERDFQIVFTKCDKIKADTTTDAIFTSARSRTGVKELQLSIGKVLLGQ